TSVEPATGLADQLAVTRGPCRARVAAAPRAGAASARGGTPAQARARGRAARVHVTEENEMAVDPNIRDALRASLVGAALVIVLLALAAPDQAIAALQGAAGGRSGGGGVVRFIDF